MSLPQANGFMEWIVGGGVAVFMIDRFLVYAKIMNAKRNGNGVRSTFHEGDRAKLENIRHLTDLGLQSLDHHEKEEQRVFGQIEMSMRQINESQRETNCALKEINAQLRNGRQR
jgi:hypothetical protein